jgi:hypothetical protein
MFLQFQLESIQDNIIKLLIISTSTNDIIDGICLGICGRGYYDYLMLL